MTEPAHTPQEETKPIYKRWWFITAAVFVILIVIATMGDEGADETPATTVAAESATTLIDDTVPTTSDPVEAVSTTEASTPTTSEPSTTTTTQASTTTTTPTIPIFEAFTVEGSGDDVIDFSIPDDQPAVLELNHSGSSNFAVLSYTSAGERGDLLVNTIGSYEGSRPVNFVTGQDVGELEITADGAWTITAQHLSEAPTMDTSFEGTGDRVVLYAGTDSRLAGTHDGDSNFVIMAWSAAGRDLLVNEIGAYDGTVRIDPATIVIEVQADGNWTLQTE